MSWIQTIADGIGAAFDFVRPALVPIPPLIMVCSIMQRPGMSAIALAAAIIRRLPEAGINTDALDDGSQNKVTAFVRILAEEFVNEIKNNARVDVAIPPGILTSFGTGANSGGPVSVFSTNTAPTTTNGIVR